MTFLTRISTLHLVGFVKIAPKATMAFSTSLVQKKTATEKVIDTAKGIDKAIADKIVDGIEKGHIHKENVAQKTKEMSGISEGETKEKARELKDQAKAGKEEIKKKI